MRSPVIQLLALLLLGANVCHGVILYSGDNSANQSSPDSARTAIFSAVASVCDSVGGNRSGSAVNIRGKYMLTANHVSMRSHVTFDGATYWTRDTRFTPVTIGTTDLKLFKLEQDPGNEPIALQTEDDGDDVSYTTGFGPNRTTHAVVGTLVGWGKGTSENGSGFVDGNDHTWTWASHYAKRWGTNQIESAVSVENIEDYNYTYTGLSIQLETNAGANEAGLALHDSGSGLFVENDGVWRLAGIATLVETSGASTFSATDGDLNYFVRIRSVADAIEAAIPDTTTYTGWAIDHSLYDTDADETADIDQDGLSQLEEFALGGDPNANDLNRHPTTALVEDTGSSYLEISLTRPKNLQGISYTAQTTTDLNDWPSDSSGIVNATPSPVDNGDGTETLTYRRSQAISESNSAFMRIQLSQ